MKYLPRKYESNIYSLYVNDEDKSVELPQYEHIQINMNVAVVLPLGRPTDTRLQDFNQVGSLIKSQIESRIFDQSSLTKHAGLCLHYCVRPLYNSRLPLSPIGGKQGESTAQHTLKYTIHTPTGRRARTLEYYLNHKMNSAIIGFVSATTTKKQHSGES